MEKLTSTFDFSTPITAQAITFFEGIFNRIAANPHLEKYRKLNWIKVCGRLVNLGLSLNACEHAERMLRDMGFRELADERVRFDSTWWMSPYYLEANIPNEYIEP